MLKVAKFGGSSMADAGQYRKVRDIITADKGRRVVIVSAAGKAEKEVIVVKHGNIISQEGGSVNP